MIYPTQRLVAIAAAGAPLALLVGIMLPGLWLLPVFWLSLVLAAAAFDAVAMPRRIDTAASAPSNVAVGEMFALRVRVAAASGARQLAAALSTDDRLALAAGGRVAIALQGNSGAADIAITARRRGVVGQQQLDLRWQGPLGLVWRQQRQPRPPALLVTPDVRPVRTDGVALLSADAAAGMMAQIQLGSGGEFDALADFRAGMDRRGIDWKQSARHSRLLAKEFRAERDSNVVLAFDCGRTMAEPIAAVSRLDRAITAGLLTAYVSLKMGDRVGLFGFDERPRVAGAATTGAGAFAGLQRLAAQLEASPAETNYTLGLSTLAARLHRRSLVMLFTDFVDTTSAELMLRSVGRLLERHVLLCIVMRDDELEGLVAAVPVTPEDVSRAVIAAGLLRERRIVLTRLRRMGVDVLETPWQQAGPALARRYLETKRRTAL